MMFDPESRYANLPVLTHVTPTGRPIAYVSRRFLPRAGQLVPVGRIAVTEDDRLDHLATRSVGDPLGYWRICDANEALRPDDLIGHPRLLLIAISP